MAASEGKERDIGRKRRGQGSQERGSRGSSARAEAGCFLSGQRTWPGRVRKDAPGRVLRPTFQRSSLNEDCDSSTKSSETAPIARVSLVSISVGTRVRFAAASTVAGVVLARPSASRPASAGWLAGKIMPRKRHERQQGGLARTSKPNTCSSRAVVPACVLAVSEGRTLRPRTLAPCCGQRLSRLRKRGIGFFRSARFFSAAPPCPTELLILTV